MIETLMTRPADLDQLTDDDRWQAVLARDAGYDGAFVLAVTSTGIYCRPSCPARRPLRRNVVFYADPAAARGAGFRACLRCKPDERASPPSQAVEAACRYLEANLDRTVTLDELGAAVGVSPHHLQRTFKRALGVSPRAWADAQRLTALKDGLRERADVTTALYDAGYGSSSRLYERAPAQLGMTPGTYRRGGAGMRIGYTIVDSPLGRLLVGATDRGVSAVSLGETDAELEAALRAEYPAADIRHDDADLHGWVAGILAHLNGQRPRLDLPLDVQATAFKRRVWETLRAIPYGSTRSYADVARAIGQPSAVRAVAHACATNPVAVVVPCHRVVRSDGSLAGYRWGVDRKQQLIERERGAAAT
jgi:AraC family transcriptional regulator of adaptative response/methylated-DNA-[protein]-cysteine methyltransferase